MRRMSPLGLIGVLIVLVIVMLLVAKNWEAAAPALGSRTSSPGRQGIESDKLPGLDQMEQKTGEHADELRRALSGIDDQ
ncbi:MAG: hypothetical protein OEQ13_11145 [Acidobacteriota bacterium]|nr:hypothetical protein [Acidobacteriota bacterium]